MSRTRAAGARNASRLEPLGATVGSTPEQFAAIIRKHRAMARVVTTGISLD